LFILLFAFPGLDDINEGGGSISGYLPIPFENTGNAY
jgi:hypothetical protein